MPGRNDLCHCGSGKKYKKCCLTAEVIPIFKSAAGESKEDLLFEAQQLVYDAWEEESSQIRIKMANKALKLSPDCADAYCLLADEKARTYKEQLNYYKKAVEAGKRVIGEELLASSETPFWGLLETRPYMRALFELAELYWIGGEPQIAIGHLQELIKLNPNDNQGVRYVLLHHLLVANDLVGAACLLEKFGDEPTANWHYGRALYYLKSDKKKEALRILKSAIKINSHVLPYLLGQKETPKHIPDGYSLGSEEEAIIYAAEGYEAWISTEGAVKWLESFVIENPEITMS